jgi:hypothetical protein
MYVQAYLFPPAGRQQQQQQQQSSYMNMQISLVKLLQ